MVKLTDEEIVTPGPMHNTALGWVLKLIVPLEMVAVPPPETVMHNTVPLPVPGNVKFCVVEDPLVREMVELQPVVHWA